MPGKLSFIAVFQLLEGTAPALLLYVTKIQITSPLTVFLKHGQLDFFNASDSISDYLSSIFQFFLLLFWILSL